MNDRGNLNEAQREALSHLSGPALVLAGAGSGKTRVVTERIAHLLHLGTPAAEILAVTFTNKAAAEMRSRVLSIAKQAVLTSTFHSLAARMLRESIEELGYQRNFAIYDEQDSENLIKQIILTSGKKTDKQQIKRVKGFISDAKNNLHAPEDFGFDGKDRQQQSLCEIYAEYQRKLKEYNALDFDDLLFLAVKLFDIPKVKEYYQNRWQFVLVDEYQDTNHAQYLLCKLLSEKHKNIFVVGDPDQSIYSWRGADMGNLLRFEKDFPGTNVIVLDQNYRSTNAILTAANALIANNDRPYQKELWSELGSGEKPEMRIFDHEKEEISFVMRRVKEYLRYVPPEEIVIFYRTNFQSRPFEDALLKNKIPYVIVGGISFYQRREIKDILAFLRLVISPSDFISFSRTINLPKRGVGKGSLEKLKNLSEETHRPIISLCQDIVSDRAILSIPKAAKNGIEQYLTIIETVQRLANEGADLSEIVVETIHETKYLDYLKEDPDTYDDRKGNLDELISKASEWEEGTGLHALSKFLEELTLKSNIEGEENAENAIRLMTLHNSKGLEFDVCFIVGMEENLLPHLNALDDPNGLEEERRLCYVGMTRAKKHLHLTASKYRFLWGSPKPMIPSRFLAEIPKSLVRGTAEAPALDKDLVPGAVVQHKDFGRGIVQKSYQSSFGLTYDVKFFSDESVRTLVAKFAKLQPATPELC